MHSDTRMESTSTEERGDEDLNRATGRAAPLLLPTRHPADIVHSS